VYTGIDLGRGWRISSTPPRTRRSKAALIGLEVQWESEGECARIIAGEWSGDRDLRDGGSSSRVRVRAY